MRRIAAIAVLLLAAAPAGAANKDIQRLQIQLAAVQGQIADMQQRSADNLTELRRLTELVADQNALLKKVGMPRENFHRIPPRHGVAVPRVEGA